MIKPIMIGDWRCHISSYTKARIAQNMLTDKEVVYEDYTLNCNKCSVPSAVLDWLLNSKLSDAWNVGVEMALHLGTDDVYERDPYKE